MRRLIITLVILLTVVGLGVAGWWYLALHPEWASWLVDQYNQAVEELGLAPSSSPDALVVSGFIEAEQAAVMSETGGRIVALYGDEGDEVNGGDLLVRLDDTLLQAQVGIAGADLVVAEAQLALVEAEVGEESVQYAQAIVEQSMAAQKAALTAWEDAEAMLENPQAQELALLGVRTQLDVVTLQEKQARALANAGQAGRDFAEEVYRLLDEFEPYDDWVLIGSFSLSSVPAWVPLPPELLDGEYFLGKYKIVIGGGLIEVYVKVTVTVPPSVLDEAWHEQATATYQSWLAWTGLAEVEAARAGLEEAVGLMTQEVRAPLDLQARANAARAQYEVATASVDVAQAQLAGLQLGATPEQIAAAEAQVAIARSALETLQLQATKLELRAPMSGLVLERPVHVGELALPGARLMTLADLENVTLTVYVPVNRLGGLQIGLPVSVTVDAYPDRVFLGRLSHIASQAEFTPKNVQTRDDRVNMVFAVRVKLPNQDHALKPGMPADAVLRSGAEQW